MQSEAENLDLLSGVISTLKPHGLRSASSWIASLPRCRRDKFLDGLDEGALAALPFLFEFWAHKHQIPPEGDWRTWVCLGGRGAGKTRAGAEWVRSMVEGATPLDKGRARRVALVGETFDQTREIMVFGPSGIMAASPPDRRPLWIAGRRRLEWANGAVATLHSAFDPEGLRGPQFDAAWVDATPAAGWRGYLVDEATPAMHDGAGWVPGAVAATAGGAVSGFEAIEVDHTMTSGAVSTTSAFIPANTLVFGVTGRVIADLTGSATSFELGVAGSTNRYGSGLGLATGSYAQGLTGSPLAYYSDTALDLTATGGTFDGGGSIRLVAHIFRMTPPV